MTVMNSKVFDPELHSWQWRRVEDPQYVTRIGNDFYYRVWAIGTPGQSAGVYTSLPGQNTVKHCTVKVA